MCKNMYASSIFIQKWSYESDSFFVPREICVFVLHDIEGLSAKTAVLHLTIDISFMFCNLAVTAWLCYKVGMSDIDTWLWWFPC